MPFPFNYLSLIAISFASGSVLYSYFLPLCIKDVNIVECSPDGNPGAANAFTYAGFGVGSICVICDILKGLVPLFFASKHLDTGNILFSLVMIAPVLGHSIAPFNSIKGGKSIAVSFGVLLGIIPQSYCVFLLAVLYISVSLILRKRSDKEKSVLVFSAFAVIMIAFTIFKGNIAITIGCCAISAIVIYKHIKKQVLS